MYRLKKLQPGHPKRDHADADDIFDAIADEGGPEAGRNVVSSYVVILPRDSLGLRTLDW